MSIPGGIYRQEITRLVRRHLEGSGASHGTARAIADSLVHLGEHERSPGEAGVKVAVRPQPAARVGVFWIAVPARGWLAAGALTAVSLGYLLIEVRNHGVAAGAALARSVLVVTAGAVHALLVSVIAMEAVLPAFVGNGGSGRDLLAIWNRPGYGHAGVVLALAAAWCLAVGVFSQILWDDRPITATLAHLSWRRE